MIGAISPALPRTIPGIFVGGEAGTVNRTINPQTQLKELPPASVVTGTLDKMPTARREDVMAVSLASAFSGNPFWARKAIQKEQSADYSLAV